LCDHRGNRKDFPVSNRPDQIQISGSVATFVILVLAIGATLLATSNIGSQSAIRPSLSQTPAPTADAFAFTGYRAFASTDGVLKLEHPETWRYVPNTAGERIYIFAPDQSGASGIAIQIRIVPRADVVAGMTGVTAQSTPREVLTAAYMQSNNASQKIDDARAGNLTGARAIQTNAIGQNGQPSGQSVDTLLFALDATNFVLVQAVAPTSQQARFQPIVDRVIASMQVGAIPVGTAAVAPATAVATQAATAPATAVATQAATAPATAIATQVATQPR
jgi:hypothetical protein